MKIITLTTDLGLSDYYVASLKGMILTKCEDVHIIDITHETQPFNIQKAAFHIVNVFRDFPVGTIHVIGVGDAPVFDFDDIKKSRLPSIMKYKDQYFISVDNGLFGYILQGEKPQEIWNIEDVVSNSINFKDITKFVLLKAACDMINGKSLNTIANKTDHFFSFPATYSAISSNRIVGKVIHIDHYGNVITNVKESEFYGIGHDIPFIITLGIDGRIKIDRISNTFNEIGEAEPVALFDLNKQLVIAMSNSANGNGGGANKLFGLKEGDTISINFTPSGTKKVMDDTLF